MPDTFDSLTAALNAAKASLALLQIRDHVIEVTIADNLATNVKLAAEWAANGTTEAGLSAQIVSLTAAIANLPKPLSFPADIGWVRVPNNSGDDTAALQAAVEANIFRNQQPATLLLAPGTYDTKGSIKWQDSSGRPRAKLNMQGGGRDFTVLSYGGPVGPAITTNSSAAADGNEGFCNSLYDFAVDTTRVPGATGISWLVSNKGVLSGMRFKGGAGGVGIDATREYSGPGLVRDTQVIGYDYGLRRAAWSSVLTLDNVSFSGQQLYAIWSRNNGIAARRVTTNGGKVRVEGDGGYLYLQDSEVGDIEVADNAHLVLRNCKHGRLTVRGVVVTAGNDYATCANRNLFGPLAGVTHLSPQDAPPAPDGQWQVATPSSLAATTAPVVYFAYGINGIADTLTINRSMRLFLADGKISLADSFKVAGANKPVFRVTAPAGSVVYIDRFNTNGGVGAILVENVNGATVVLRDGWMSYGTVYRGAGRVFVDDVASFGGYYTRDGSPPPNTTPHYIVTKGGELYARQINTEFGTVEKVRLDGARAFLLGHKTEGHQTALRLVNGAACDSGGAFHYEGSGTFDSKLPLMSATDSLLSVDYYEGAEDVSGVATAATVQVRETRAGVVKESLKSGLPKRGAGTFGRVGR